jgi:formate/nitrite transporter FocA (FNT family)
MSDASFPHRSPQDAGAAANAVETEGIRKQFSGDIVAVDKVGYGFGQAVVLGVLCNALVALTMWMAVGARGVTGKTVTIIFPITVFVAAGCEHSIANI